MPQCRISLESYTNHLRDGFAELQHSEEFVDMTIAADGHLVKVHKNLMALASPFIREMIKSAPCPHPVIFLSSIRKQILSYILEYVYTGEVTVMAEHVIELIKAAKLLHLKGLESMIPPPPVPHSMNGQTHAIPVPNSNVENNNDIENNDLSKIHSAGIKCIDLRDTTSETNDNHPKRVIDLTGQIVTNDPQVLDCYISNTYNTQDTNSLNICSNTQEPVLEEQNNYATNNYSVSHTKDPEILGEQDNYVTNNYTVSNTQEPGVLREQDNYATNNFSVNNTQAPGDLEEQDNYATNNMQENEDDYCINNMQENEDDYCINNYDDDDVEMQLQVVEPNTNSVNEPVPAPTAITINFDAQNSNNVHIDSANKHITVTDASRASFIYYTGSSKGSVQLIANRFMYYIHHTTKSGSCRWRCIDYRAKGCKAFIDTFDGMITLRKNNHLHPLHDEKIEKIGRKYGTFGTLDEAKLHIAAEKVKMFAKKKAKGNNSESD